MPMLLGNKTTKLPKTLARGIICAIFNFTAPSPEAKGRPLRSFAQNLAHLADLLSSDAQVSRKDLLPT
jgi:hypothetical protein